MKKKFQLTALLALTATCSYAQNSTTETEKDMKQDNMQFLFSESQLGEDDDMTSDVIQVNSASNIYTSQIGYTWGGSMRFKFRALDTRYSDVFMNGVQVNNAENGRFNFSTVGGMNDAVRNKDAANPFEDNTFSISHIGGASNYDLRAADMASGHKITLSGCNRNYTARAMYTFGTGLTQNGWAFFGTIGYRWANMNTAAVEGTFYNSAAYFLALQKVFNEKHSLSLSTWGNPTERATSTASTDEAYWLANNYQYNPNWGYQNGEKRASRIVNNFEPSALLTWDFNINDRMKLTTSAFVKYALYSSSKLNYNDSQNPAPDYWKNFPSSYYDVWDEANVMNWEFGVKSWEDAYSRWQTPEGRQIQWDDLYAKNRGLNEEGKDAAYFILKRHNNHLATNLGSTFEYNISNNKKLRTGVQLSSNKGMHYQTISDLMGAENMHNINNYAIGTYLADADEVQYDLRNRNGVVREGDKYGYNYNLITQNAKLWASYSVDKGISHNFISAKISGTQMWRNGFMQNGMCKEYSYGKSGKARFLDGGFKMGSNLNLGHGNVITMGVGYETNAPKANVSFESPEMNNSYVANLKNEKLVSAELGYALNCSWLQLNLNGFFYHTYDGTDYQNFYNDDENSFTYNSLSGITKNYYGVELGAKFKINSSFDIVALGTWSDAIYTKDCNATYMISTSAKVKQDICHTKNIRENGTPLTAASLALNYRVNGYYLSLTGNYYDRIYLSYSPNMRYEANMTTAGLVNGDGSFNVPEQAKGKGGFMLDASIGKQIKIGKNPMSINLTLSNITNNRTIVTGGYEQSRSNYSTRKSGDKGTERLYDFTKNPKKFYAQGFNFLLNLNYRF